MANPTNMNSSGFLGYKTPVSLQVQKDEIKRLNAANQLIGGVLGELHNIQELIGLNAVAEVEDLSGKIKKGREKIQEYLARYEQGEELNQGQQAKMSGDSIPLEAHPELKDMGGMPLELDKLDKEFLDELGVSDMQDKAEMQNQAKNKVQDRLKNALKLAAKLQNKLKSQPKNKPGFKQANEMVKQYKLTLEDLKNKPVLKPEPEAPEYTPTYIPPKPRPPGQG